MPGRTAWNNGHVDDVRGPFEGIARYWDSVALRYLDLFRSELQRKPFDVALLKAFAARLGVGAAVCDIGCGPCGHVTRLLADGGLQVRGIDISPKCIELARREQPSLTFEVMDMGAMTFNECAFDGLVAYYALHYQPKHALDRVLPEFFRVLRPGGLLLVVSKEGNQEGIVTDPLGSGQSVYWCALPMYELTALLSLSGFRILSCVTREPLPDEMPVRRIYVHAERPRKSIESVEAES